MYVLVHVCLPFNFTISKESDLLWYLHVSTIDIQVHKHIVIKQIFGMNVKCDIQVNVKYVIA